MQRVVTRRLPKHADLSRQAVSMSYRTEHLIAARSASQVRTYQRAQPSMDFELSMPSGTPTPPAIRFRRMLIWPVIRGLRYLSSRLERL